MGQIFGKASARQFQLWVSHVVAVDITWSYSSLSSGSPGLNVQESSLTWLAVGYDCWMRFSRLLTTCLLHVASPAQQSQDSWGAYVVSKSKYPSCNTFYDVHWKSHSVTSAMFCWLAGSHRYKGRRNRLHLLMGEWQGSRKRDGTRDIIVAIFGKHYLLQMLMGVTKTE